MNTCDMCGKSSDSEEDLLLYGDWMIKQKIRVHYFCLLMSTHLPQRGGDSSGILGFLLRDIRIEMAAAKRRKCIYCLELGATVACHKCRSYFHLPCGVHYHCVLEFCNEYRSYCADCRPINDYQRQLLAHPPSTETCPICFLPIVSFALHSVVYGECCRGGFAHRLCMRRYALSSGYYLICIWCRSKKFRDLMRLQSIFVPDRDATWEREQNAYRELHSKHLRCDQPNCLCPKGRNFNKNIWLIVSCKLCASSGGHAKCLPVPKTDDFKCDICLEVEQRLERKVVSSSKTNSPLEASAADEVIDASFYVPKTAAAIALPLDDEAPLFSDSEDTISNASVVTVISSQKRSQISPPTEQPRSELVLKQSFNCENESYFYLEIYEFDEQTDNCKGTCTLRFNEQDARIQDRSIQALQQLEFKETDVWFREPLKE